MAVAVGNFLGEIESTWYSFKTNTMPANTELSDRKRTYWASQAGGVQGADEDQMALEIRWLQSLTGVTSNQYDEAWLQAVAGAGGVPQGNTIANKILYYKTVA